MAKIARLSQGGDFNLKGELVEFLSELVGGRNLMRYGKNPVSLPPGWGATFVIENDSALSENVYAIKNALSSERTGPTVRVLVKPNTQYTISVLCKPTVNMRDMNIFFLNRAQGSVADYDFILSKTSINTTPNVWTEITWTFTTGATAYEGYIRFDNNASTDGLESKLSITNIKIEEGPLATGWTYAPEDLGLTIPSWVESFPKGPIGMVSEGLLTQEFSEMPDNLTFNGTTDQRVVVPLQTATLSSFSAEILVRSDDVSLDQTLFSQNPPFFIRMQGGKLRIGLHTTGTWDFQNGLIPLVSNKWHHLALTYDGTRLKGYVDGVLDIDVPHTASVSLPTSAVVGYPVNAGENFRMKGVLSEAGLWSRSLSQTELGSTIVGNEAELLGHWKLGEGAGAVSYDSSPKNNYGVITGATWGYPSVHPMSSTSKDVNIRGEFSEVTELI